MPESLIYECADIGQGTYVGPFCIIGVGEGGVGQSGRPTVIGEFSIIRSHVVIYGGVRIGKRFQAGHGVLIREDTAIGDGVSIGSGSVIEHHVVIGARARLHSNVFVPEYTVIEEDAWLGPNVVCTNAKYPRSPGVKDSLMGPRIRSHAKVGANATLLPGITVGRGALVGAGSVVTRDVPENAVVAGNPARVLKSTKELPYAFALSADK